MIIVLVSPDNLSMSMFMDFYRARVHQHLQVHDMHSLFSEGAKIRMMEEIVQAHHKTSGAIHFMLRYKVKKGLIKSVEDLPLCISRDADFIYCFDRYSTELQSYKYRDQAIHDQIVKGWDHGLAKMSRTDHTS